jgi:hypothetical protein
MAGENTRTTLSGLFKTVYGEYHSLLPKGFKIQRDAAFRKSKRLGDKFSENVLLAHEHGVTYASPTRDAYAITAAVPGATQEATVQGSQILIRSRIGYNAAKSAATGGEAAFRRAFDVVVENMALSGRKRVEIDMWYGQAARGLGEIDAVVDGTPGTVRISQATWAPGNWAGMEGAKVSIVEAANNALVAADFLRTIEGIDLDTRIITLDTVTTASTDNMDSVSYNTQKTVGDGTAAATVADQSCLGLDGILNPGVNLFGIPVADFSLWNPGSFVASGALDFDNVNRAIYKAIQRGLDDDLILYVNPNVWVDLLNDEIGQRRHTESSKVDRYNVGAEGIEYYTQTGTVMIKASNYCKEGSAYLIPAKYYSRIGATDLTFNVLGEDDGYFLWVNDTASYEMRMYSNQALFTPQPGKGVSITGHTLS